MSGWRFAIDRGGTFTDLLGLDPAGGRHALKLLSVAPGQYPDAVLDGIRRLLQWPEQQSLRDAPIDSVRLGTTVATNALLERRGARVGLLLSKGFVDLLAIDDQSRSDLFDLQIRKPEPLYETVATVAGRLSADGEELQSLDKHGLRDRLAQWKEAGVGAIAISFMHAWRYSEHELVAADVAREMGFDCVVCGHQASPLTRYLDRSHTAVIDAYLTPVVRQYIAGLEAELGANRLLLMQSDGALVAAEEFRGATAVLSGPAGGASACAALSAQFEMVAEPSQPVAGLIGFDMGGTSTDVCVALGGRVARSWRQVAGVRLGLPMLEVHTVAAGGGSIIDYVDGQLAVGPASAGADPGPACYGRGGPATITDANLVLGRLHPPDLPRVFGADGKQLVDPDAARERLTQLVDRISEQGGPSYDVETLAAGAIALADESMAQAVHGLTTARGVDPAGLRINGFGGAAGQHLCGVAEQLGATELCLHPYAGVLSAWGIGIRAEGRYAEVPIEAALDDAALVQAQTQLRRYLRERPQRLQGQETTIRTSLRTRLAGGGELVFSLPVEDLEQLSESARLGLVGSLQAAFAQRFEQHFGYPPPVSDCIIAALTVEEAAKAPHWPASVTDGKASAPGSLAAHDGVSALQLAHYQHDQLGQGDEVAGPALISHPLSTLYLAPNWRLRVSADGMWQISRQRVQSAAVAGPANSEAQVDPVQLALYHHRFMHIAEQMGEVLRASARSVNIRERLDYSCALFDAQGQLIANAPHMPVHLGSMGESVRAVLTDFATTLAPGDAYVLNDPYRGGTHLPDVTVVTPAFDDQGELLALFASRAHHADVGGISPGSMPAASRCVEDEGVLIKPTRVVSRGELHRALIDSLFRTGPWPSRDPALNVGEVEAQLAANNRGVEQFRQLLQAQGAAAVGAYLVHVLDHTESLLRERLRGLANGRAEVLLDQGLRICVAIEIDPSAGAICVDFNGTSSQSEDNYNAPSAVVRAAVLYVLRCLLAHPVPLNEGFARPLTLKLPPASMVSPVYPAAVVAGNVETSQAITDALLLALDAQAGSQGTMNNLSFGNADYQYYETVCGGAGAGPGFDGASAVHTHMTNSRITDPEVLERRFPLRLERFERRRDSGGAGRWCGGDGVVRRIRFLQPVELSILASRRRYPAPGLAGGEDGRPGMSLVIDKTGTERQLGHAQSLSVEAGEAVELRTPGGGGYGTAD